LHEILLDLVKFHLFLLILYLIEKSSSKFAKNLNESFLGPSLSVLTKFHLVNEQNLLVEPKLAVTYLNITKYNQPGPKENRRIYL
jgi:hypothetical protein